MRTYYDLPLGVVTGYWQQVAQGLQPLPWNTPPLFQVPGAGLYDVRAMLIVTVTGRAYELGDYREFYRLMFRDSYLRLVHEGPNERDEIILQVFGTYKGPELLLVAPEGKVLPFRAKP